VILVTGGAGYIGRHTVAALRVAGFDVIVFDDFSTGHRDFVADVPFVEGDLLRREDLGNVFANHSIEGVLHFAGRALVGESRHGVPQTETIDEEHPQVPINPYGETKLAFEKAMGWFRKAHGLEYLSLRYFNAAGADSNGAWGEDHDPETHLIPLVLEAAAGLRKDVSIFGTDYPTPDGTGIRDYIHVTDLAEAHVKAIRMLLDGSVESQAVNLGTGTGASVREVIDVARKVTGRDVKAVEAARREGDPPRLVASADRARSVLDWRPRQSDLPSIVETAWNWMRRRKGI
jgi:UDP-glucose 4-epimerase